VIPARLAKGGFSTALRTAGAVIQHAEKAGGLKPAATKTDTNRAARVAQGESSAANNFLK
jgi:hypothetical protein